VNLNHTTPNVLSLGQLLVACERLEVFKIAAVPKIVSHLLDNSIVIFDVPLDYPILNVPRSKQPVFLVSRSFNHIPQASLPYNSRSSSSFASRAFAISSASGRIIHKGHVAGPPSASRGWLRGTSASAKPREVESQCHSVETGATNWRCCGSGALHRQVPLPSYIIHWCHWRPGQFDHSERSRSPAFYSVSFWRTG